MPRATQRTSELRSTLLDAASMRLEAGDTALTARSVAAAAGTSTAALYELFGDKSGLLRSLFYDAFRRLEVVLGGVARGDNSRTDLLAVLGSARRFALDHPRLFELMFSRPFAEFRPTPEDERAGSGTFRTVMRFVDAAIDAGVIAGDRVDLAQVLIATNRGLIASELAGILASSPSAAERRWQLAIHALLDGLAPRS
jgi:AcrR family transcriptional regulator